MIDAATAPWPAETWQSAVNLTSLAASDWQTNLSGAFWNPVKRQLWLANNSGMFYKLVEGGPLGFMIDTAGGKPGKWTCGGDAEGITQADLEGGSVFVMNEDGYIEEYSTAVNGKVSKLHSWDIRSVAAPVDGSGPEGIAFVPDEFLAAQGFTDKAGKPARSAGGMGGLFFVAHQNGGYLHVFDCNRTDNKAVHVGSYSTGRDESSDLAFDRSIGVLYVWHNTGPNYVEAMRLSSAPGGGGYRALTPIKEFLGPKSGNLEGMAMTPAASKERWYFATDDDNQDGHALMWFKTFDPGIGEATAVQAQTRAGRGARAGRFRADGVEVSGQAPGFSRPAFRTWSRAR